MLELFNKGGVVMYPILVLSVIALALFMERIISLRKSKYAPQPLVKQLKMLLRRREYEEALNLCKEDGSALANIMEDAISHSDEAPAEMLSAAENAGRRASDKLNLPLDVMGGIAAMSPLMGLLGTVFGMIRLFNVLSGGGVGDPQALSGGIAEALLTTAAGLCVAIPATVFYYIIKMRNEAIVTNLEQETASLTNIIATKD